MHNQKTHWTEEEDAALTMLRQQRHIADWGQIARILTDQFNFDKKNSKQCKQRYANHLSAPISKVQWTPEEQKMFMELHNQIGNKWATIAQHLIGKDDNCVKNHFYSKLRKLLRKLNKVIQFYLRKEFRPIDISIMYKIVEAAQERFKEKPNCQKNVSIECMNVQNKMLEFAMFLEPQDQQQQQQFEYTTSKIQQYKQLIREIYRVSKLYKRKSKKVRNSLIQAPTNNGKKKAKIQSIKMQEKEYFDVKLSKQKLPTTILMKSAKNEQSNQVKEQNSADANSVKICLKQNNQKNTRGNNHEKKNAKIQVEEGQGIHQMLRTAGILQDEIKNNENKSSIRKFSLSQHSSTSIINPLVSSPTLSAMQTPLNFYNNNGMNSYQPLSSFNSQQVENFLGFPMIKPGNANNFSGFALSQKSSFKSYSQADPSEIENPFFDYQSSNNARCMFPMNFSLAATQQYQQLYSPHPSYASISYPNQFYGNEQKQQEEEYQSYEKKNN